VKISIMNLKLHIHIISWSKNA